MRDDLCDKAVKVARRIQALSEGIYRIIIVKDGGRWIMMVEGEDGKAEVIK